VTLWTALCLKKWRQCSTFVTRRPVIAVVRCFCQSQAGQESQGRVERRSVWTKITAYLFYWTVWVTQDLVGAFFLVSTRWTNIGNASTSLICWAKRYLFIEWCWSGPFCQYHYIVLNFLSNFMGVPMERKILKSLRKLSVEQFFFRVKVLFWYKTMPFLNILALIWK